MSYPSAETPPADVADYLSELTRELAAMARGAGLPTVAARLEQAHRAAAAEAAALQSVGRKAAPDDAA